MPFNIGFPELILILIVALIVFGPGKLPEIGGAIGKGMREFRKASMDVTRQFTEELKQESEQSKAATAPSAPKGVTCPTCQTENTTGSKFCSACGNQLPTGTA